MREIRVRTERRQQLVEITDQVREVVGGEPCRAVLVYCPHTTAGIVINEHADPDVARDIITALERMVPTQEIYRHVEGNSPAHVKASLVGTCQTVPVENGELALGTWQGVFLAEFDGPRQRRVLVAHLD